MNSQRKKFSYLSDSEYRILRALDTPMKVQDFVSAIPQNFERGGDSCMSVREVLKNNRAHCIEGALVAALAFAVNGAKPLIMDLTASDEDDDHIVTLFKKDGYWGAVSKGNHAVVRYRDPIYRTVRELAMSYFHEYYIDNGKKTLRSYSRPFNLSKYKKEDWITGVDAWKIAEDVCDIKHYPFVNKKQIRMLRPLDPIQIRVGKMTVYKR